MKDPVSANSGTIKAPKDSASISKNPQPKDFLTPAPSTSIDTGAGAGSIPKELQHNETDFEKVEKTYASGSNNNQNKKKMGGVYMDRLASIENMKELLEVVRFEGSSALEAGDSDKAASSAVTYNALKEAMRLTDEIEDKNAKLDYIQTLQDRGVLPGAMEKLAASNNVSETLAHWFGEDDKTAGVKNYIKAISGAGVKSRRDALEILKLPKNIPGLENPYSRYNAVEKAYKKLAEAIKLQGMTRQATAVGVGAGALGTAATVGTVDSLSNYRGYYPYFDKRAAGRLGGAPAGRTLDAARGTPKFIPPINTSPGSSSMFRKMLGSRTGKAGIGLAALTAAGLGGKYLWDKYNKPWYLQKEGIAGISALLGAGIGAGVGKGLYGNQGALLGAGLGAVGGGGLGYNYSDDIAGYAGDFKDKFSSYSSYNYHNDKTALWGQLAKMGGKVWGSTAGKAAIGAAGVGATALGGKYIYDKMKRPWYARKKGTAGIGALLGAGVGAGLGRMVYGDQGALLGAGLGAVGGGHLGYKYNDQIIDYAQDFKDKFSSYNGYNPYMDRNMILEHEYPYYNDKTAFWGQIAKFGGRALGATKGLWDDAIKVGAPIIKGTPNAVKTFGKRVYGTEASNAYKNLLNMRKAFPGDPTQLKFAKDLFEKERVLRNATRIGSGLFGVGAMNAAFGGRDKNNSYYEYNPYMDKIAANIEEGDGWWDRVQRQLPGITLGGAALATGLAMGGRGSSLMKHIPGSLGKGVRSLGSKANSLLSHGGSLPRVRFDQGMVRSALKAGGATALGTGVLGIGDYDSAIVNSILHNPVKAGLFGGALGASMFKKNGMGGDAFKIANPNVPKLGPVPNIPNLAELPLGLMGVGGAGIVADEATRKNSWLRDFFGQDSTTVLPASMYPGAINPYLGAAAGGLLAGGGQMLGDYMISGKSPSLKHLGTGLMGAAAGGLGANAYNYLGNLDYSRMVRVPRKDPLF